MATNFPTGLDNFPNPSAATNLNAGGNLTHSVQHTNINDSIEALENYVGIVNSTVPTSLTNKIDTISQFIAKTLTFYFDGELGSDANGDGTIANPFKSIVGLKNRVLENSIAGAITNRNILERSSGATRPEAKQMWVLSFATNLVLLFKNKSTAGIAQTYDLGLYTVSSAQTMTVGSYTNTPYDLSLANPNKIMAKISSYSEYLVYPLDSINGGMGTPYQGSVATFVAGRELMFWVIDVATCYDRRVRDAWSVNSSNFQTFNNTTVIYPLPEASSDQFTQAAGSSTPGQHLFSNFRYGNVNGATTSNWNDVIAWCEAGQLYSTYLNGLCTTRFSGLYSNAHNMLVSAPRILFRWSKVRLRDGAITPPTYLGFNEYYIEIYGTHTINERTSGASMLGVYYSNADAQSRINLQDYSSTYAGFTSRYDSYTNVSVINLAYAGVVNTSTNKLYYPNAKYSLT